ncbi:MAG: cofactor-independent phosphoglycerate mutase [Deltaproteobacteria bacterium]|nr:cofactor-independent phosphoglycerate mutase [Deltaproteobacteria bacterium]
MKYVVIQGDGMGDQPVESLGGKTPLEAAHTPNFDRVASHGLFGLVHTIPPGYPPGSDVGNLALFGYDPRKYYTGRSPLEAAAMGVALAPEDVSFRMNLVTVEGPEQGLIMDDYSAGHIDSAEAAQLVAAIAEQLSNATMSFYPGVSYRHLMVWKGGPLDMDTTPPHDITGKPIAGHLPKGPGADRLVKMMETSRAILRDHPVNQKRLAQGKRPATQAWLWGQGKAPHMPTFQEIYGLSGAVISAVDLVRGVARYAGFENIAVPGITGYLDTNYRGKGEYALRALDTHDLVFIHVEAPDEAGHMGNEAEKVKAIEAIDREVLGPLLEQLPKLGDFRVLITSDHATPVALRTHTPAAVPFAMADHRQLAAAPGATWHYCEKDAAAARVEITEGYTIMDRLVKG